MNESPSLEEYKDGIPAEKADPRKRQMIIRIAIIILGILSLVIWAKGMADTGAIDLITGKGAVRGRVISDEGEPVLGEVFILGMEQEVPTNPDGSFHLSGIPAGFRSLVVSHNGAAEEYPLEINAGEVSDLHEITFHIVTPVPESE